MIWEVAPCSQLAGRIAVPGSKSHTIRAVIAALLGNGTSEIISPLYSADTRSALNAAKILGASVGELLCSFRQHDREPLQGVPCALPILEMPFTSH